jgi:hypothetical protein
MFPVVAVPTNSTGVIVPANCAGAHRAARWSSWRRRTRTEPDMGSLHDHRHAVQQDDLVAPVKLVQRVALRILAKRREREYPTNKQKPWTGGPGLLDFARCTGSVLRALIPSDDWAAAKLEVQAHLQDALVFRDVEVEVHWGKRQIDRAGTEPVVVVFDERSKPIGEGVFAADADGPAAACLAPQCDDARDCGGSTLHPSLGTRDQQDLRRQLAIELGQRCFRKTSWSCCPIAW